VSLAFVLAMAWAAVVAALLARARPQPVPRALALLPERRPASHFRAGHADPPPRLHIELPSRRTLTVGGVIAVGAGVVLPPLGLAVLTVLFMRPVAARRRVARAQTVRIDQNIGEVVTLVGLAVSAGHNLTGALRAASAHDDGPVAMALQHSLRQVERGERLADALESLPASLGESIRPTVAALVACDRYGAPLGATLDRLSAEVRVANRQRAEAAARRLPVRLLFPLVSCILPAFALLTVAPLIAGSLRGLRL
jgi:tight adherence protein C